MNARSDFDTLAPEFSLRVNGSPLPTEAAADLIDVVVLEDVDAMSMFTFSLTCYDSAEMKVKWIDDALFREGNPVEIEIGYRDNKRTVFSGEITGLEPTFLESSPPTLTVRGYDRRHRLARERKTRSYTNVKDSDIASRLAATAGLTPQADDTKVTLPYLLQHNQTDLEFLLSRARRIDHEIVVDDRTLIFRPRRIDRDAALTLRREIELLDFRPRMTTMGQVEELLVKGWNAKDKKEIVGRAGTSDVKSLMAGKASGASSVSGLFGKSGSASVVSAVQSQDDADAVARQRFGEMALGYIRCDGQCIGEPTLRAGVVVKIEGVGERFSGLYYVTSAEQRFSPKKGYRTRFAARRNAT
ncbi:Phage late control gene D protein (GPD) [Caballeronia calidae]|uniref:Phage late control gene D protein (GPD) n=1 Tax=Caballeronia calidae TaxID=1777139 RepID=A0A158AYH0_9BURK|nr:contractile injection system protein, VgrG/Pvc8 family [Caballeronia calidae]SAK63031.1 Phage late control gene D protein (GPD) [Caballeronia calidae]